jgi:hypothetical protein
MGPFLPRLLVLVTYCVLFPANTATADPVPIRHIEGLTFGFLVLRNLDAQPLAYGDLKQVVKNGVVVDDLKCNFKGGSLYEEITKIHPARRIPPDKRSREAERPIV